VLVLQPSPTFSFYSNYARRKAIATRDDIAKLIMALASAFPNFKPGYSAGERKTRLSEMGQAYTAILGDLDADRLAQAAYHLASTNTGFPTASELRRAYFNLEERAAGVPTADEAWAEVRGLFRRGYSQYRAPTSETFSHPRVEKALRGIGGWRMLCSSENDAADRARFVQAYETHTKRDQEMSRMLPTVRQAVEQLAGRHRRALMDGDTAQVGPHSNVGEEA